MTAVMKNLIEMQRKYHWQPAPPPHPTPTQQPSQMTFEQTEPWTCLLFRLGPQRLPFRQCKPPWLAAEHFTYWGPSYISAGRMINCFEVLVNQKKQVHPSTSTQEVFHKQVKLRTRKLNGKSIYQLEASPTPAFAGIPATHDLPPAQSTAVSPVKFIL